MCKLSCVKKNSIFFLPFEIKFVRVILALPDDFVDSKKKMLNR